MADLIAVSKSLQSIALALEEMLKDLSGERMAFMLIVSTFGEPQKTGDDTQYVSNCRREDAIKIMEQQLNRFRIMPTDRPLHKKRENDG